MAVRWEAFLTAVQDRGAYPEPYEAERASQVVLALLGAHVVGTVRAQLAAQLPARRRSLRFCSTRCNPLSR
ncbi:hypothetical protein GCM10009839_94030 [Catenulispora yoronensis]|uniref:DUF2267 domain-containing protein n=1 Tax=Catenulispora yoronensis TaxID=450799 RepID=A0ABP5HBC4_9ACTN